jgi:tetratricopeptide (TPR) repeat protein
MDENGKGFNSARGLIWEKVPFILLTIASSLVTFWGQNKVGALVSIERISLLKRVTNAIISYIAYLEKTFCPVNLAVFYPYEHSFPFWQVIASCFILIGITIVVIYIRKKMSFLFVGWFWYLGTMIPLIGLIQAGSQAMADRHTYLPSIGIAIMLAWGIPLLCQTVGIRKKILLPAAIAVLCILVVSTWMQCAYWKNSIELFSHALRVTKNNYLMHNDRGTTYANLGQYQLAISDYNNAIRLKEDYADAYYNRGRAYYKIGHYQHATEDYNEAIRLKPEHAYAYNNRGILYGELGQYQLAMKDFNKAIRLKPDYAEAYNNRGTTYGKISQYQCAIEDFSKAIDLKKDYADAYNNRGITYFRQGNNKHCCDDIRKACKLGKCKTLEAAKSSGNCR